jgi:NAD(P)H dehydrogenase (quinone)
LQHGALVGAASEGGVASAARSDYAAAAVSVLLGEGHANKVYELAGDTSFTLSELAGEIARRSGKPVAYKNLKPAEYAAMLLGFGLPKELTEYLADADAQAAHGALDDKSGTLRKLMGKATTPISESIECSLQA